jgi:hypothetical protein
MTNRRKNSSGGIGVVTILWVTFLILKLTHVIDWAWVWVFAPLWIAASLGALFIIVIGVIILLAVIGLTNKNSKMNKEIRSWFKGKEKEES